MVKHWHRLPREGVDSQLSLRGDFQNPTGHGSGQSAPADAAGGGVGPGGLQRPPPTAAIPGFCAAASAMGRQGGKQPGQ